MLGTFQKYKIYNNGDYSIIIFNDREWFDAEWKLNLALTLRECIKIFENNVKWPIMFSRCYTISNFTRMICKLYKMF